MTKSIVMDDDKEDEASCCLPLPPPVPLHMASQMKEFRTARSTFTSIHLHFAINKSSEADVARLISEGADVEYTIHGNTPLILSILREQISTAQRLLKAGADASHPEKTRWQRQPIHLAARLGNTTLICDLLRHGASVHATDATLLSVLHWAALSGHSTVVRLLVEAGAHLNVRDDAMRTPLFRAVENGHLDVVHYLADQGAAINMVDYNGWTPLILSVVAGNLNTVRCLLSLGVNLDQRDHRGQTAVHAAAARLRSENLMAMSQADINVQTRLLRIACASVKQALASDDDYHIMLLLIDAGADVNIIDTRGQTPLRLASVAEHTDLACLLLAAGAHPEPWIHDWVDNTQMDTSVRDWLTPRLGVTIQSLTMYCKWAIRRSLLPTISSSITRLPLPEKLKEFLQLNLSPV